MSRSKTILRVLTLTGAMVAAASGSKALAQCDKLGPRDAGTGDGFGRSISISGNSLVAGVLYDDDACPTDPCCFSGSAYVFRREGIDWVEEAKLTASDAAQGDHFGYAVATNGVYVVVGAANPYEEGGFYRGSTYVFTQDETNWVEEVVLEPSDPVQCRGFGSSVAIEGDYIVIGAPMVSTGDIDDPCHSFRPPGSAYVFRRTAGTWNEVAKLAASDGTDFNRFGCSVSCSGDTIVVGAKKDDEGAYNAGAAYVFTRDETEWVEQAKLIPNDPMQLGYFGKSVSVSGDYLVVGAGYVSGSHTAYVFEKQGSDWIEVDELTTGDGATLGHSVAISGDRIVAGAYSTDGSGSAYLFQRDGPSWPELQKLVAFDADQGDALGWSVSISDSITVVGAPGDDPSGSAYVYDASSNDCNCNGVPDESDDCNENSTPDNVDIEQSTSPDCNGNCTPDECELGDDCNSTGIIDICDIVEGTSNDCNRNRIPDECDLAAGTSNDCNINEIPDECERDSDCDGNGIRDICDIADGTLSDDNGNGFPDECLCDEPVYVLVPAAASGDHTIVDNEIILSGGRWQRVFLEVRMCGWDPDLDGEPPLHCAWTKHDPSGFSNGISPTDLGYALHPCTTNANCEAALGIGSKCNYPDPGGGYCSPGFVDESRPEWVGALLPKTSIYGVWNPDDGFHLLLPIPYPDIYDDGAVKYFGTLALDVPSDASGTFTIGLLEYPDSAMNLGGQFTAPTLSPAVITIEPAPIPTVSTWGLIAMTLSLLALGSIVVTRRRSITL